MKKSLEDDLVREFILENGFYVLGRILRPKKPREGHPIEGITFYLSIGKIKRPLGLAYIDAENNLIPINQDIPIIEGYAKEIEDLDMLIKKFLHDEEINNKVDIEKLSSEFNTRKYNHLNKTQIYQILKSFHEYDGDLSTATKNLPYARNTISMYWRLAGLKLSHEIK